MTDQQSYDSLQHRIRQEFSRSVLQSRDRDFIRIFAVILIFETFLVTLMTLQPAEEYSQDQIGRIQEQFADFIINQAKREAEAPVTAMAGIPAGAAGEDAETGAAEPSVREQEVQESPGAGTGGTGEDSGEDLRADSPAERQMDRQAAAEVRRQSREAISKSVSSKGLLGLLTGSGSAAQGEAVDDVLTGSGRGNGMNRDLDQILSSVDGLQTQGGSGMGSPDGSASGIGGVRGSRSGERTSIDDLVSERSDLATASMSRQGDLYLESPTDVAGRGSKSANRSPDAIREVLLDHVPAIRYCYERELKMNPELKGKISVRITIGSEGEVIDAEVLSSTLSNPRVERCILARIRLWKDFKPIDPAEGEVTFRQVYTFGV